MTSDPIPGTVPDSDTLLGYFDGDVELMREIIDLFLLACPARMSAIRKAVECRDSEALAQAAHALKGGVASFAAAAAFSAAQRLETAGATNDWTDIDQAVTELEVQIESVNRELSVLRGRG